MSHILMIMHERVAGITKVGQIDSPVCFCLPHATPELHFISLCEFRVRANKINLFSLECFFCFFFFFAVSSTAAVIWIRFAEIFSRAEHGNFSDTAKPLCSRANGNCIRGSVILNRVENPAGCNRKFHARNQRFESRWETGEKVHLRQK